MFKRQPDFVIGGQKPYLLRWWVIPRNKWFNIYLHKILRDDDDRALHDHPWVNCSIPLKNGYVEVVPFGNDPSCQVNIRKKRHVGIPIFRRAIAAHRLELHRGIDGTPIPCWSLFITGPIVREWGFWCPQGWRPWKQFVSLKNKGEIGQGCGD